MDRLKSMLKLQQELNDNTNGTGWEEGVTKNNKVIDWRRCILLESAELIDSYPWKHWKSIDATADYENIKIETVDIWHFVMSEALRLNKIENSGSIDKLAEDIYSLKSYQAFINGEISKPSSFYDEIKNIEQMIANLYCNESIESLINDFCIIASQSNLTIESLYSLYIGKNVLNSFRQKHGYKDGSYQKIWRGKEDNVVMQEILNSNPNISVDELFEALEREYSDI